MLFLRTQFTLLSLFILGLIGCAQPSETIAEVYVYHTPYGNRYHTSSCHMVDNTSNAILLEEAIRLGLSACSFCDPDSSSSENYGGLSEQPESTPGQKSESTRCLGITKKGERCKHPTKNANGFCFQHLPT